MTSSLEYPLRRAAPVSVDAVTAQRLWRGVVARRARRRHSATRIAILWLAVGAVTGTLLTVAVEWSLGSRPRAEAPAVGPLMLADGSPWGITAAPRERREVALADGSHVTLEPGARFLPLENTGRAVSLLMVRGRATFDVRPGGPRRWSFECGLATVEIVGTRLSLERTEERLLVEVERGVVLVRGERVPDRVQRLGAGARLEVLGTAEKPPAPPPTPSAAAERGPATIENAARGAWRGLSTRGDYAAAYRALGPSGMGVASSASKRVDELMALADVARLSGHSAEAIVPLTRVVREFATDPRAALAAFTLGKIYLSEPAGSRNAAADFADALQLGLPASLVEDAYANSVEALRRAGDAARARAVALEFVARFPSSPRSAALRDWASGP